MYACRKWRAHKVMQNLLGQDLADNRNPEI